jgi:predicted PP-loop superfamily ATPase
MEKEMKKLLDLGFKKVPTEDGLVMYELTPAKLDSIKVELKKILKTNQDARSRKLQAASNKPQAASNKQPVTIRKRLDKSR